MGSVFIRGFRRLFGLKEKSVKRIAPYGSIARPVLLNEEIKIPKKNKKIIKKKKGGVK